MYSEEIIQHVNSDHLQSQSSAYSRFEVDKEALCNTLHLSEYVKATGNIKGHKLKETAAQLTLHSNTSECPMGRVMLYVNRNGVKHCLRFAFSMPK